jgi:hypothetical protein
MRRGKITIMQSKTAVDTRLIRATVYGIPSKTRYFPLTASADRTNVDKNNPPGAQQHALSFCLISWTAMTIPAHINSGIIAHMHAMKLNSMELLGLSPEKKILAR